MSARLYWGGNPPNPPKSVRCGLRPRWGDTPHTPPNWGRTPKPPKLYGEKDESAVKILDDAIVFHKSKG